MIDDATLIRKFLTASVAAEATGALDSGIDTDDMTITLGSGEGAAFPSSQNFVVKIDSELMHVTRSGDVLTVETGTRGSFGTTAASHDAAATVSQANLYLTIGAAAYTTLPPDDYENKVPAVVLTALPGKSDARGALYSPRYQFKCYGGSEAERDAKAVYRMLRDRLCGQHGQATTEGRIVNAVEEQTGQVVPEPDVDPPWWAALVFYGVTVTPA